MEKGTPLPPDEELLRRITSRSDRDAFGTLVGRHGDLVHSIAFRILHDPADAQDTAQETWIAVLRDAGKFVPRGAIRAWIGGIAVNHARNRLRKRLRSETRDRGAATTAHVQAPGDAMEKREERERIEACVRALPEEECDAILLHYYEGLSQEETAAALGTSLPTAKWRIHQGLDRLREKMAATGLTLTAAALVASMRATPAYASPPGLTGTILGLSTGAAGAAVAGTVAREALLAGGAIMKGKTTITVAAALLAACMATGVAIRQAIDQRKQEAEIVALRGRLAQAEDRSGRGGPGDPDASPTLALAEARERIAALEREIFERDARLATEGTSAGSPEARPLRERIEMFDAWVQERVRGVDERRPEFERDPTLYSRLQKEFQEELSLKADDLRLVIKADPGGYLTLLRGETDLARLKLLLSPLLRQPGNNPQRVPFIDVTSADYYPPEFLDGIEEILRTGTEAQREAVYGLVKGFWPRASIPESLNDAALDMLDSPSPRLQQAFLEGMEQCHDIIPGERFETIRRIADAPGVGVSLASALRAIAQVEDPRAEEYLLERLESNVDPALTGSLVQALSFRRTTDHRTGGGRSEDPQRCAVALVGALAQAPGNEQVCVEVTMFAIDHLPMPLAQDVLLQIVQSPPSDRCAVVVGAVLDRMRTGETRPDILKQAIYDLEDSSKR
ncbi:MAG: RNA polymerase sigma factor [Planctomycetes bacterium]|nr:RNA polymerase sigma factor [Planctomycetota bacterium]